MPLLLTILTACYLPVATPAQPNPQTLQALSAWLQKWTGRLQALLLRLWAFIKTIYVKLMQTSFMQKHKKLVAFLLAILLIFAFYGAFFTSVGLHDPIVIGHRGSAYGVENTLDAIQHAIDAGANYAEVDILLSADGIPMVIHDTNLKRLSGQNVNVYDLTAEQLQSIPLTQNGYSGYIPTLQEAIAFCDGKILLAVELKLHGHEQTDLVTAVMQEIKQSRYQKDCLLLSLDYNLVSQVKQQYQSYKAGYCVYGNIGQLTPQSLLGMEIDFLLVEEWMVEANLLAACRKAWLPVYVWTVNDPEKMQDYLQMGVVGLVTDYPDAAVELLGTMYNLAAA